MQVGQSAGAEVWLVLVRRIPVQTQAGLQLLDESLLELPSINVQLLHEQVVLFVDP